MNQSDAQPRPEELSLVYLAVDHLNVKFAQWLAKRRPPLTQNVLTNAFTEFCKDLREWSPASEVRSLFGACGVVPSVDDEVLKDLLECIAYPAKAMVEHRSDSEQLFWTLEGKPRLPPSPAEETLFKDLHVRRLNGVYSFTTIDYEANLTPWGAAEQIERERKVHLIDEFLDPLVAIRMYLMRVHKVREAEVGHHIQQWIVAEFGLDPHQEFRFTLAKVCDRVNELFYGQTRPKREHLSTHGATVGTALLVGEIARLLTVSNPQSRLPQNREAAMPLAVGIYLFLRLRRLVRFRYQFFEDEPAARGGRGTTERAANNRQCVSMLRPLEYTFLQTAIFGMQTAVQGLNFILRGGLLPRADTGRSFVITGPAGCGKTLLALQLLCDVASKGGLAVYYSFEEDYGSIAERLVTFDLRREGFRILLGSSEHLETLLREKEEGIDPKGTLLFYQMNADESLHLNEAITTIAASTSHYSLRALAIDSLNALSYASYETADMFRKMLHGVVRTVEQGCFLGFLLSEADDPRLNVLPYISDTLIELSPASRGRMRRMEIRKCRTQDYHRGPHPYHLSERRGVTVYPSLGSIRESLRNRVTSTLSVNRSIALPSRLGAKLGLDSIQEKSATMVFGSPEGGALPFALQLITEPSTTARARASRSGPVEKVNSVLVITFNTSEVKFAQMLRRHAELSNRWEAIAHEGEVQIRWYSPGGSLTGDQIVAELRQYFLRSRRFGLPIERVLFLEVELAEQLLPSLASEPLFWPTVLQMLATEAVTSVFVMNHSEEVYLRSQSESGFDYSFHFSHEVPDGIESPKEVGEANESGPEDGAALDPALPRTNAGRAKPSPAEYSVSGMMEIRRAPHLGRDLVGRWAELKLARNGLIA